MGVCINTDINTLTSVAAVQQAYVEKQHTQYFQGLRDALQLI